MVGAELFTAVFSYLARRSISTSGERSEEYLPVGGYYGAFEQPRPVSGVELNCVRSPL